VALESCPSGSFNLLAPGEEEPSEEPRKILDCAVELMDKSFR
jgi:hypothetical protein